MKWPNKCACWKAKWTTKHNNGQNCHKSQWEDRENCKFKVVVLWLNFPQISISLLYENVAQKLGYNKCYAKQVQKSFTEKPQQSANGCIIDVY